MSILVDGDTKVLVQGITGEAGSFHAKGCREYGTRIVGGVTPGKGGSFVDGVPVFDTVREAVAQTGADATLVFVPPRFAADAVLEAADANVRLIVAVTEGIPVLDMARVKAALRGSQSLLIGPNGPGLITPSDEARPGCKVGIMPGTIHRPGRIGVVSRSGTLTYEAVWQLTRRGVGQSTVVGVGGDPIKGLGFTEVLALFEKDPGTDAVLLIGEIGGADEEEAADYFRAGMTKPLFAFIAGRTAPAGKRMGHAGAIVEGGGKGSGAWKDKRDALAVAGVKVIESAAEIGEAVVRGLKS